MKTTTVGLSPKAIELVKKESEKRKEIGLSASLSAVASEAVVKTFGGGRK